VANEFCRKFQEKNPPEQLFSTASDGKQFDEFEETRARHDGQRQFSRKTKSFFPAAAHCVLARLTKRKDRKFSSQLDGEIASKATKMMMINCSTVVVILLNTP
jgi:hypothetical protein